MKILVTRGGWDGHEPFQTTDIFINWLKEQGYEVIVSDTLDAYNDLDNLKTFDLLIPMWTMGTIAGEQEKNLLEAIKNGLNVAGWHGGMCDAFRANTNYQFMTGGQWVSHPGGIIDYSVEITKPEDPIVKGIKPFMMKSEQYYMHVDPSNEVLATTTFKGDQEGMDWIKGTVMPVAWKRYYGKARIFYTSLGHVASDFSVPEALEIMKRGIKWAMFGSV